MGNMQTTINCMKLEALGNTIIGNGLPVIGSKCRQYVIRNMNNRLPTKSPRSDLDLVQQETHLALGSECLWTDRVTVACVVRVCVFTNNTNNILGKPMSHAIATCAVHACSFTERNHWDRPLDTYHTLLCTTLDQQQGYTAMRQETCRP